MQRFLRDSYQAALENDRDRLLMELNFAGPSLNLGSIYNVIAERSSDGSLLSYIACVDMNPEHSHEEAEFAELAANTMGVRVRFFQVSLKPGTASSWGVRCWGRARSCAQQVRPRNC